MLTPAASIVPTLSGWTSSGPPGLVVSSSALARHGATLRTREVEGQPRLQACVEDRPVNDGATAPPVAPAFRAFGANMLDWSFSPKGYAGTHELPILPESEVHLPASAEVRRRKFAVRREPAAAPKPTNGNRTEASPCQTLVGVSPQDDSCDRLVHQDRHRCLPHGRMERRPRGTGAPAGLVAPFIARQGFQLQSSGTAPQEREANK